MLHIQNYYIFQNKCKKLLRAENIALTDLLKYILDVLNIFGYNTSLLAIYIATIKNYGNYVQVNVKKSEFSRLRLLSLGWSKEHWIKHIGMNWIQPIIDNCPELRVLDLMDTELSEESIEYVAKNVTPKLSKISICGFPFQTTYDIVTNFRFYCQQKIEKFENRCNNLNGRLNTYHRGNNMCLSNIRDIEGNINQDGLENWRNIISTFRSFE